MPQNILQTSLTTREGIFLLHYSVCLSQWNRWMTSEWCIVGLGCLALGSSFQSRKKEFKFFMDALSRHHKLSSWKARDPKISRHWTKTSQKKSLLVSQWGNKTSKDLRLLTAGGKSSLLAVYKHKLTWKKKPIERKDNVNTYGNPTVVYLQQLKILTNVNRIRVTHHDHKTQ